MRMITYVLAVWRLAHMVVKEDGPGDILPTVRDWTVQTEWVPEWVAKAFQCVSCASIWIAGFLLLVDRTPLRWVRWVLAGSAVAKLLEDYFYESAGEIFDLSEVVEEVKPGIPVEFP